MLTRCNNDDTLDCVAVSDLIVALSKQFRDQLLTDGWCMNVIGGLHTMGNNFIKFEGRATTFLLVTVSVSISLSF